MTDWYFLDVINAKHGPFSDAELLDLYIHRLNDNTLVWNQHMHDWEPIINFRTALNLPHHPAVRIQFLRYFEVQRKFYDAYLSSYNVSVSWNFIHNIKLCEAVNAHFILKQCFNNNPFAIYLFISRYKYSILKLTNSSQNVDFFITLMETLWVQLNYPALFIREIFVPPIKDNKLNRWLDKLFASTHSELQLQIGILQLYYMREAIFDALATNSAYCELGHNMSIPHIFAINHNFAKEFSVSYKKEKLPLCLRWIRRSAENDNITAAALLGFLYYTGVCGNVFNRNSEARKWLGKAAEQGNEAAIYLLTKLDR